MLRRVPRGTGRNTSKKGTAMRFLQMTVAAFLVAGLSATAAAEEKKTDVKKLLVGKWEVTKADPDTISVGAVVEFTADGKMKITEKQGGKVEMLEGSYTVEGNAFNIALKVGD